MNITADKITAGRDYYYGTPDKADTNGHNTLSFLKKIADTMTDPLFIINENGSFFEVNTAASAILGYEKNEIFRMPFSKIDPRLSENNWKILTSRIEKTGSLSDKACHITINDSIIPVQMTWNYLSASSKNYYVGVARYIRGNRTANSEDLSEIFNNITLAADTSEEAETIFRENNIEELKKTFCRMIEKNRDSLEEEKIKALGDLISGIAHEINTPLGNAITLLSHIIDEIKKHEETRPGQNGRETGALLEKTVQYSDSIMQNLGKSSAIIDRFKIAASASNDDQMTLFNIKDTVYSALSHLYDEYKKKNHSIEINCPDDLEINGYRDSFANIISQLFQNSLIHAFAGKTGGKSKIKIKQTENSLEIDYTDNGRGLTEEERKKIFEPFFTTKRSAGFSGLGMFTTLSIVKRKMKGSMKCYSSEGSGTLFRIVIPRDQYTL